jgi:hypothetical protein
MQDLFQAFIGMGFGVGVLFLCPLSLVANVVYTHSARPSSAGEGRY